MVNNADQEKVATCTPAAAGRGGSLPLKGRGPAFPAETEELVYSAPITSCRFRRARNPRRIMGREIPTHGCHLPAITTPTVCCEFQLRES